VLAKEIVPARALLVAAAVGVIILSSAPPPAATAEHAAHSHAHDIAFSVDYFANHGFNGFPFDIVCDFQLVVRPVDAVLSKLGGIAALSHEVIAGAQSQGGHAAAEEDTFFHYIHNIYFEFNG
jgi:hypothetical protein